MQSSSHQPSTAQITKQYPHNPKGEMANAAAESVATKARSLIQAIQRNSPPSKADVLHLAQALHAREGAADAVGDVARLSSARSADLASHGDPRLLHVHASLPIFSAMASVHGARSAATMLKQRRAYGLKATRASLLCVLEAAKKECDTDAARSAFYALERHGADGRLPGVHRNEREHGNIVNARTRRTFVRTLLHCDDVASARDYVTNEAAVAPPKACVATAHACAAIADATGALACASVAERNASTATRNALPSSQSIESAYCKAHVLHGDGSAAARSLYRGQIDVSFLLYWVTNTLALPDDESETRANVLHSLESLKQQELIDAAVDLHAVVPGGRWGADNESGDAPE